METDEGFLSPIDETGNADASVTDAVQRALQEDIDVPKPAAPADNSVALPGGIQRADHLIATAEVRELTGEHEEILAKATQAKAGNIFHFMNVLLECGVVRFGSEDPALTKKLLKTAILGDRDALIVGIRRVTYGDIIELKEWQCPECGEKSDLEIPVEDIPYKEVDNPEDLVFEVDLLKGRKARVRLANGSDQLATFENAKLTLAERDTLLLSRCLVALIDADGTEHTTVGFASSYARSLNAGDRATLREELRQRQPGPRLDEMKIDHEICGKEVELLLSIADLFPGLRMV